MKLIKALKEITTSVENVLVAAGLKDGLLLSVDEIKAATEPMFWFVYVKSKEASDKQNYLVWNFQLINKQNGDGSTLAYPFDVSINFYSSNKIVDTYLENIENAFIDSSYIFEFSSVNYDTNRMMYSYSFIVRAMVSE